MELLNKKTLTYGKRECGVPQCKTYKTPGVSMHRIPKEILDSKEQKQKWMFALKMGKDFPKYFNICSNHFKIDDFLIPLKREGIKHRILLKKTAFPTKNLPIVSASQIIRQMEKTRRKRSTIHNKTYKSTSQAKYRKILMEEPEELAGLNSPTKNDPSEIAFEYVEVKEESDCSITNNESIIPLTSNIFYTAESFTEITNPKGESPLENPITHHLSQQLKRKSQNNKSLTLDKSYLTSKNKPKMVDKACQTDIQDPKDELIDMLKLQNKKLKKRVAAKETDNQFGKITVQSLKRENKKVQYLTGFPNFITMEIFYKIVENHMQFTTGNNMCKFDIFFMTLMKLKLNLSLNFLSILMNVSLSTISQLFYESFIILYDQISKYVIWPDNTNSRQNTPTCYKQIFGDGRFLIVDCFEIFSDQRFNINNLPCSSVQDTPTIVQERAIQTGIAKLQPLPVKYLLCFSTEGRIIYHSEPFDTRLSKRCIAQQCGFLDTIETEDIILASCEFVSEFVDNLNHKSKNIVPMVKNIEGNLVEIVFEITDEFIKLRDDIDKMIYFAKQHIELLTNRPLVSAISNKYGEEKYWDFVIKMACTTVNLMFSQSDIVLASEMEESDADT